MSLSRGHPLRSPKTGTHKENHQFTQVTDKQTLSYTNSLVHEIRLIKKTLYITTEKVFNKIVLNNGLHMLLTSKVKHTEYL